MDLNVVLMLLWSPTESLVLFQTRSCTSFSSFGSWAAWRWRPPRTLTSSMRPWDRSWQREPYTTSSGWPSLICSSHANAWSELRCLLFSQLCWTDPGSGLCCSSLKRACEYVKHFKCVWVNTTQKMWTFRVCSFLPYLVGLKRTLVL